MGEEKLAPYALLGEAMSTIWGARRAIRSNTPAQKLGSVIQLLNVIGRRFELEDQGDFFRLPGLFEACGRSVDLLRRETNRQYTRSGEVNMEDLGWCLESALEDLDRVEDELRGWWVDLMCRENAPAPLQQVPITDPMFANALSQIHGIEPDPIHPAMKMYDLLRADGSGITINDELANAKEPIVAGGDRIRVIPHFSDLEAGE
jgi:hypothetical protein